MSEATPTPTFDVLLNNLQENEDFEPSARDVVVSMKEIYREMARTQFTLGYQLGMVGFLLDFFEDGNTETDSAESL